MTASVRQQILEAVTARMAAIASPPGITVYQERRLPVDEAKLPALVVTAGVTDDVDYAISQVARNFMGVQIEYLAAIASSDDAMAAARDTLWVAVLQAVHSDRTWGGLAVDTTESGEQEPDLARTEGVSSLSAGTVSLRIEFWTKPGDPTSLAP
jgi:hypothetical protein